MNMPYKVYNSMKSGLCLYSDCEQLQQVKGPLTERLPVILQSPIMFVVLGCRMKFTCSVTFFSVQFSLQLHVLCSPPPPPPPQPPPPPIAKQVAIAYIHGRKFPLVNSPLYTGIAH